MLTEPLPRASWAELWNGASTSIDVFGLHKRAPFGPEALDFMKDEILCPLGCRGCAGPSGECRALEDFPEASPERCAQNGGRWCTTEGHEKGNNGGDF